jgi:hypothetical protein
LNCFNKRVNITGVCFAIFLFSAPSALIADNNLIDSDLDTLFDENAESMESAPSAENQDVNSRSLLQDFIMGAGFGIDTSYSIMGGYLPGWSEVPWYYDEDEEDSASNFTNLIGAKMSATVGLDIQPSRFLRIRQSFTFSIPAPALTIKDFFFDYNLKDKFFFKAGKYEITWGISPNFPFANLLARIPLGMGNPGEPYLAKLNIPVDIGGFEFILLTRPGYIADINNPRLENFGSGGKYNLALPNFDLDIGFFYFELIPFRNFISVKTTLFRKIEFYVETMTNIFYDKQIESWGDFGFSTTLGFFYGFLKDKLRINGEIYYNGEGDTTSLRRNNLLNDNAEEFMLFNGFNGALNISYKPGSFAKMHIFTSCLYAFEKNSAQIVPGITFEPAEHIELYFAVLAALGSRDKNSYYYHNADTNNRPLSIVLAVKIKGAYKYGHFE